MIDLKLALKHFSEGPSILEDCLRGVSPEESDFVPSPGKWTIRQIVRHVADTEIVAGMRLRQMLAEDRPTLIPFSQDAWADNLRYWKADIAVALATFTTLRDDTSALLNAAPPEAFERVGVHPERGDKTLGEWVALFARHIETHAGQIREIRKKVAA